MYFILLAIEVAKIALVAIILWFVCSFLPMPDKARWICQLLIALIAILSALGLFVSDAPFARSHSMDRVPSIMTPERR